MMWTLADTHGLDDVLIALSRGREVYALEATGAGSYDLSKADGWQAGHHSLGAFRPTQPLKSLFFPARELIGRWKGESVRAPMPERIVFGVKNCDLSSLAVFDYVFLQGVARDPYYAEARDKTILVSTDCSGQRDTCFCTAVGEQPWPERGFDINIADTPDGLLFEGGTARGAQLLQTVESLLAPAGENLVTTLEAQRKQRRGELEALAGAHGLTARQDFKAAVEGAFESDLWAEFAKDCVECGACNFICCTCHCFLLTDGVDTDGEAARGKVWDACLYAGFARTAGGGTPRPFRAERLRNRFDKKFSFFPQVLGRYACDGCGRCTEACIAKIDIRDVLRGAVEVSREDR